jgi:threonylcarbamoyladenosine tRNA methylthiotransferase MtaB
LKTVSFYTLGCKVNSYDTAYMRQLFLQNGYTAVDFGQPVDITVVNTCPVTAVADKKSRAAIRRAAKHSKVIVAGCMAQKQAQELLSWDEVDAVIGTDERSGIVNVAERLLAGEAKINATHGLKGCGYEPMSLSEPGERTRGVIKIQEGCDNFCSYCIIPYVRGRSRSRSLSSILDEAESLAKSGVKELVLTGIHIASYSDGGSSLGDIVSKLGGLKGVRVRLGSIEPGFLGEDFVRQAAETENLCPHFHLSLQSGSGSVLRRMNRKYTPEEYLRFTELLRTHFDKPAITTDIIAGFPGETPDEHRETMDFVEKIAFSRLHVFPFSPREGTKAYDMQPKVPKHIARQRADELLALGKACEEKYALSLIGLKAQVLFEDESDAYPGCLEGYSERYVRVAASARPGELKAVTLKGVKGTVIYGV